MAFELILAGGALILAFLMGTVAGVGLTIAILVRHVQRKGREAAPNPSLGDLVRATDRQLRTVSEALDRPLADSRPGRKVK